MWSTEQYQQSMTSKLGLNHAYGWILVGQAEQRERPKLGTWQWKARAEPMGVCSEKTSPTLGSQGICGWAKISTSEDQHALISKEGKSHRPCLEKRAKQPIVLGFRGCKWLGDGWQMRQRCLPLSEGQALCTWHRAWPSSMGYSPCGRGTTWGKYSSMADSSSPPQISPAKSGLCHVAASRKSWLLTSCLRGARQLWLPWLVFLARRSNCRPALASRKHNGGDQLEHKGELYAICLKREAWSIRRVRIARDESSEESLVEAARGGFFVKGRKAHGERLRERRLIAGDLCVCVCAHAKHTQEEEHRV